MLKINKKFTSYKYNIQSVVFNTQENTYETTNDFYLTTIYGNGNKIINLIHFREDFFSV